MTGGGLTPEQVAARAFNRLLVLVCPSDWWPTESRRTTAALKEAFVNSVVQDMACMRGTK